MARGVKSATGRPCELVDKLARLALSARRRGETVAEAAQSSDSVPTGDQDDLLILLPDGSVYSVPTAVLANYRVDIGREQRYREIRAEDVLPGFEYADDDDADAATETTTSAAAPVQGLLYHQPRAGPGRTGPTKR
jgi:hypothetical protein